MIGGGGITHGDERLVGQIGHLDSGVGGQRVRFGDHQQAGLRPQCCRCDGNRRRCCAGDQRTVHLAVQQSPIRLGESQLDYLPVDFGHLAVSFGQDGPEPWTEHRQSDAQLGSSAVRAGPAQHVVHGLDRALCQRKQPNLVIGEGDAA